VSGLSVAERAVPLKDLESMTADIRAELDAVWHETVSTSAFIGGETVRRFEDQWSAFAGTAHAVGVANGTDAVELALRALGIGAGDEVIVPANTFVATVEAVVLAGATPRLVDVDEETLLLTPEIAAEAVSGRTAAIIAVDLYGNMPRLDELATLAERLEIALIEDAAQAQGGRWKGKPAGSFGDAGCFSFYPGKNLGAFGDAGAVVTNDGPLADAVRMLANHGRPPHSAQIHSVVARNSRLDALQAGILSAKLTLLEKWNEALRNAVRTYAELLPEDVRPLTIEPEAVSAYHQHVVRLERRDAAMEALRARGVQCEIHYPIPCHLQAPYEPYATTPLPTIERAAGEILSLPLFPHITEPQIAYVCECLKDHLSEVESGY
jgi:dTDP-4-amino-4,6-dideoxygalactose transaminase